MPSTPIILNAANEILVSEFLKKKTAFFEHIQTYFRHYEG